MTLVEEMNDECEQTLDQANREYATDVDKFNNFHVTAFILREINPRLKDIQAEDIAFIFMVKHLFSIAKGVSIREDMRGRFKDCINYIHLIHGIHVDKKEDIEAAETHQVLMQDSPDGMVAIHERGMESNQ